VRRCWSPSCATRKAKATRLLTVKSDKGEFVLDNQESVLLWAKVTNAAKYNPAYVSFHLISLPIPFSSHRLPPSPLSLLPRLSLALSQFKIPIHDPSPENHGQACCPPIEQRITLPLIRQDRFRAVRSSPLNRRKKKTKKLVSRFRGDGFCG